jgi:deoxyhypusine synthase
MTWGKVDPDKLPDTVTCYTDSTIALPLLTAYSLARRESRPLKRLYDRREASYEALRSAYEEQRKVEGVRTGMATRQAQGRHHHGAPADHPHTLDRDR